MEKVNNNNENKEKANDIKNKQINSETSNSETKQEPDEPLTLLRKAEKEEEEEFDQMIKQQQEKRKEKLEYYRRYLTLGRILWDIGSVSAIFGGFLTFIAGDSALLSAIASHTHPSLSPSFEVGFAIWIVGLVMALLGRIIREKADDWP